MGKIPWEYLPREMGCGSGMSCWRRLRDWQQAGVWERLHRVLLDRLGEAGRIDWTRASLDAASVPAPKGGRRPGRTRPTGGKRGTKHHILAERGGLPLAALIGPANAHDSLSFAALLDAVPPIRQRRGAPRRRPEKLHADKGYDFERCRRAARQRHIWPRIARRGVESTQRLGRHRWVVERTLSWLHRQRRLRIRYERRPDIHQAFLTLACSLICFRLLHRFC